jgi:hypothetical protein
MDDVCVFVCVCLFSISPRASGCVVLYSLHPEHYRVIGPVDQPEEDMNVNSLCWYNQSDIRMSLRVETECSISCG